VRGRKNQEALGFKGVQLNASKKNGPANKRALRSHFNPKRKVFLKDLRGGPFFLGDQRVSPSSQIRKKRRKIEVGRESSGKTTHSDEASGLSRIKEGQERRAWTYWFRKAEGEEGPSGRCFTNEEERDRPDLGGAPAPASCHICGCQSEEGRCGLENDRLKPWKARTALLSEGGSSSPTINIGACRSLHKGNTGSERRPPEETVRGERRRYREVPQISDANRRKGDSCGPKSSQ